MKDFGRKDFGSVLKNILEAGDPRQAQPESDEVDPFASKDAVSQDAGDDDAQDATVKDLPKLLDAFEAKFATIKNALKLAVDDATTKFEAYQAFIKGRKMSGGETTDDQAQSVLGKPDKRRANRIASAPEDGSRTPSGLLKQASRKELQAGLDPKTKISTAADSKDVAGADFTAAGGKGEANPATRHAALKTKYPAAGQGV